VDCDDEGGLGFCSTYGKAVERKAIQSLRLRLHSGLR
jgi:hypothetical protein